MPKWTRTQRKRHKEEVELGIKPDIRPVFLSAKMKAKREAKRRKVTQRLLGKR
jgi:hypothetical protein